MDVAFLHRAELRVVFLLVLTAIVGRPLPAWGQMEPPGNVPGAASSAVDRLRSEFEQQIEQIETEFQVPEASRAAARALYRDTALPILDQAQEFAAQADAFAEEARTAPERLAKLEGQLRSPSFPAVDLSGRSLEALQRMRTERTEAASRVQSELTLLEERLRELRDRPRRLAEELTSAKQKLADIDAELNAPASAPAEEDPLLAIARRDVLRARRIRRAEQIRQLQLEQGGLDVRIRATELQRDWLLRRLRELEQELEAIETALNAWRAEAAAQARLDDAVALQLARQADQNPLIVELAKTNALLSAELQQVELKLADAVVQGEKVEARLAALRRQFESSRQLVELIGAEGEAGNELLYRRKRVPQFQREWNRVSAGREEAIRYARLRAWELERDLGGVPQVGDAMLPRLTPDTRPPAQRLLDGQEARLRSLLDAWGRYRRELVDLYAQEQASVEELIAYREYLDTQLLWKRSAAPVGLHTFSALAESGRSLADPESWRQAGAHLVGQVRRAPAEVALAILVVVGLTVFRRRLRRRVRALATVVGRVTTDSFSHTPEAILWTALLALPTASATAYVGWLMIRDPLAPDPARAIGVGLMPMGVLIFIIQFARGLLREDGVVRAHFRWPAETINQVNRNLRWLVWVAPPLGFLLFWSIESDLDAVRGGAGLLSFEAAMVLLWLRMSQYLYGKAGIIEWLRELGRKRWSWRLTGVLLRIFTLLPLVLAGLALLGYHYAAFQLALQLVASLLLIGGIAILSATVHRMLALAETRLEIKRLREQRATERAGAGRKEITGEMLPVAEPTLVGVKEINTQTRRLAQTVLVLITALGLLGIWAPTLPALSVLNEVVLWRVQIPGSSEVRMINLGRVLLSLVVIVITLAAARNLPGLLEILVLDPMGLDPGTRYASTSILRYVITGVGLVMAFDHLGLGWSQLQWLVAALGVGLGFGLQEIFANFVSGLIILFERPVRVNDIVTIGDVTGVVSRIRIRATTITDWDRKEYIVPNKEFVTGRLLNWTLSDPVNRVVISVGIAYGSDTEKARELLFQVCREEPLVMDDPTALITFEGFGDSTLNFTVRAYLPNLDNRLEAIHRLHTRIHSVFAREGIEIAFPQRDVHIRTAPAESISSDPPAGAP